MMIILNKFLFEDKKIKIKKYNELKSVKVKIKYIDCDVESYSYMVEK